VLLWETRYDTRRPLQALPRLLTVAAEEQTDAAYRHEGRHRQGEGHCLFKYSLAGEGAFRDAAGEHRVPAGTGFLCEIRDPATAYYYPPAAAAPWRFVYAAFDGPAATALVRELTGRYGPLYRLPAAGGLVARLEACAGEDDMPREIGAAAGGALVMDLLLGLLAAGEARSRRRLSPAQALVGRARVVVEGHLERDLDASGLAHLLGVSREHLTRCFRAELGVSPYRYIVRQKMLLACHLLKETDLPAKAVAARLGYTAPSHFTRLFKRTLRMTPSRFRRDGVMPVA
jgi:AraC-like DNA-binding protein